MSRNARNEKDSENSSNESLAMKSKGFPLRVAILAKMANMATNLANIRQSLNKNLDDVANRPFESGNFNENGDFGEKSPKPYLQVK